MNRKTNYGMRDNNILIKKLSKESALHLIKSFCLKLYFTSKPQQICFN